MLDKKYAESFSIVKRIKDDNGVTKKRAFRKRKISEDAQRLQDAMDNIDPTLQSLFLESDYINDTLEEFYSKTYSKKTYEEKVQLFANLALCCSHVFGDNIIEDGVTVIKYPVNERSIFIEDGKLYMSKDRFDKNSMGIINLMDFIFEFRKHIILLLTTSATALQIKPSELKGMARIYYENACESILEGSWNNYRSMDEIDYYNQPIVIDSTKVCLDYGFIYIKRLYQKYKKMDAETSAITQNHMNFYGAITQLREKRNEIIRKNRENVDNYDTDLDNYERYLSVTASDLSKLTDKEFFALFNSSYYVALNLDDDGLLTKRLEGMANGLIERGFSEFNLDGIQLPTYQLQYNKSENTMVLVKKCLNGDVEVAVEDSSEIFTNVLTDMITLAEKYALVRFNNEQERQDWIDMSEWKKLKKGQFNENDIRVLEDGLNIILSKITEFLTDLTNKIEDAIKDSDFLPHCDSMIRGEDRDAYYDYYEFKNGATREEVRNRLMIYIRNDLKNMTNKGGR